MDQNRFYIIQTISRIWIWFPIILIALIGLIKSCLGNGIDPMDDSVNTAREIVSHVEVLDSTNNGFRVVYATVKKVSKERYYEISNRPHILESFERLQNESPLYFGSLLYTDIYDFARYARRFDVDEDIQIHNIFVSGIKKMNLYAGYNPKISKYATWIDPNTEQGVQYLSYKDIYFSINSPDRVYRYWRCKSIFSTSYEDERFSHFSEDERVY